MVKHLLGDRETYLGESFLGVKCGGWYNYTLENLGAGKCV